MLLLRYGIKNSQIGCLNATEKVSPESAIVEFFCCGVGDGHATDEGAETTSEEDS